MFLKVSISTFTDIAVIPSSCKQQNSCFEFYVDVFHYPNRTLVLCKILLILQYSAGGLIKYTL